MTGTQVLEPYPFIAFPGMLIEAGLEVEQLELEHQYHLLNPPHQVSCLCDQLLHKPFKAHWWFRWGWDTNVQTTAGSFCTLSTLLVGEL